jgi:hypothetical protein
LEVFEPDEYLTLHSFTVETSRLRQDDVGQHISHDRTRGIHTLSLPLARVTGVLLSKTQN